MNSTSQPSRRTVLAGLGGIAAAAASLPYLGGARAQAAVAGRPQLHGSPAKLIPAAGSWFGAYPGGGNANPGAYEALAGRKLDAVMRYEALDGAWPNQADRQLVAEGRWLSVCWSSRLRSGGTATWADVAAGRYDWAIRAQAHRLTSLGPVWVGYDNEMDGAARVAKSGPLWHYPAAYRHIQEIVRPIAPEVVWVWCPTGNNRTDAVANSYPGDYFIDWICYDPYDPNLKKGGPYEAYQRFPAWLYDRNIGDSKPLGICETGFHRDLDDETAAVEWIWAVPPALERLGIRLWQWFNSSGGLGDTSVAPGSRVANALRAIGGHPVMKQPHG